MIPSSLRMQPAPYGEVGHQDAAARDYPYFRVSSLEYHRASRTLPPLAAVELESRESRVSVIKEERGETSSPSLDHPAFV